MSPYPTEFPRRRPAGLAIRWLIASLATALLLPGGFPASAQIARPTDYQVKAAYLYNFGRFIQWPTTSDASKSGSFQVCIFGRDPFGSTLDHVLAGESISGKPVIARRLSNIQESSGCRILFLSADEESEMNQVLQGLDNEAVLTVSDIPRFSQRGGMIQFVLEGNRVRFEVNLAAAQHAGLTLSSELLKVAAAVHGSPASRD
jgi:hypothetical protein